MRTNTAPAADLTTDANDLSQKLSLQFLQALSQAIQLDGGTPQLLQPSPVWDWGGKAPMPGTVTWAQYSTLDQVPTAPVLNPGAQGAMTGFGESYKLFLNFLNPFGSDPTADRLSLAVKTANNQYAADRAAAYTAWQNSVTSTGSTATFTDWLASDDGFAANNTLTQDKAVVARAQGEYDGYLASVSGPISDAAAQYTANLVAATNPQGTSQKVPSWSLERAAWDHVQNITGQNFGGDATKGNARSFAIDQEATSYDYTKTWAEAEAGGLFDWFGIFGDGSYERIDTSSFSSTYKISFSFQDLTAIRVSPGGWYNPAIAANYAKGPYYDGHSGFDDGSGNPYFFGVDGTLAQMYTYMVVAYRPTVTLDAGEDFAKQMQEKIKGGGGFAIGPFEFGAEGGKDTQEAETSFDGSTITVTGKGDWPYVLALVTVWVVPPRA